MYHTTANVNQQELTDAIKKLKLLKKAKNVNAEDPSHITQLEVRE